MRIKVNPAPGSDAALSVVNSSTNQATQLLFDSSKYDLFVVSRRLFATACSLRAIDDVAKHVLSQAAVMQQIHDTRYSQESEIRQLFEPIEVTDSELEGMLNLDDNSTRFPV